MGALIAGIKLSIAQLISSIIIFFLYLIMLVAVQLERVRHHIETVASDPAAAGSLPATVILLFIGFVPFRCSYRDTL
jgi:hypothetical protein